MRRLLVAAFSSLCLPGLALYAQDARQIEAGRRVYDSQGCAKCHMVVGQGNKTFPLDGVGSRLSADEIRRWLTHTAQMEDALPKTPAIKMSSKKYDLKDADLDALVAFLQSLKRTND